MIGLVAVTAAGRTAAGRLAAAWPDETRVYEGPASAAVPRAWSECDALVCFLATGATVRLVAPLLADKHTDPAVVCVDEAARYAIALVGGHAGGANDLAARIGGVLGAAAGRHHRHRRDRRTRTRRARLAGRRRRRRARGGEPRGPGRRARTPGHRRHLAPARAAAERRRFRRHHARCAGPRRRRRKAPHPRHRPQRPAGLDAPSSCGRPPSSSASGRAAA